MQVVKNDPDFPLSQGKLRVYSVEKLRSEIRSDFIYVLQLFSYGSYEGEVVSGWEFVLERLRSGQSSLDVRFASTKISCEISGRPRMEFFNRIGQNLPLAVSHFLHRTRANPAASPPLVTC